MGRIKTLSGHEMAHQATPLNLNEKIIAFSPKVKWSVNDQWKAQRWDLFEGRTRQKVKKAKASYRWSSPWGEPLSPAPSAGRPWPAPSGPRSPSAWRWGRRSPSSPPSPCWSGCLTAAAGWPEGAEEDVGLIHSRHLRLYYCHRYKNYFYVSHVGSCCSLFFFSSSTIRVNMCLYVWHLCPSTISGEHIWNHCLLFYSVHLICLWWDSAVLTGKKNQYIHITQAVFPHKIGMLPLFFLM